MATELSAIDRASGFEGHRGLDQWSSRKLFASVFGVAFAIYATTALIVSAHSADALTNAITSWSVARTGSPVVPEFDQIATPPGVFVPNTPWIVESPRGPISQYPPGAALTALPAYVVADLVGVNSAPAFFTSADGEGTVDVTVAPPWIGSLTGAAVTALAIAVIALTVQDRHGTNIALWSGAIFGLATSSWMVAGMDIWQHGPAMLWVAVGVLMGERAGYSRSGLAFALAILTRPHLAAIAAGVGIAAGIKDRSFKPVAIIGALSAAGLAGVIGYNFWIYGDLTLSGGYGGDFSTQLGSSQESQLIWYLKNIIGGLVNPSKGLLVYSPFIVVLAAKLTSGWRKSDLIGRGAAIGGVVYLLVQWKANRFSGGDTFWGYRYPLEPLAALVLLGVAAWETVKEDERLNKAFKALVATAVFVQFLGAFS